MKKLKILKNKIYLAFKSGFLKKWGKNSVYLAFIRAYSIPTLPPKVELFYYNIFVSIFRFIAGISLLLIVTKIYLFLPGFLHLFLAILASIHITQIIIILIIKIFYGVYIIVFKKEIFEIRNSPLNRNESIFSLAWYCLIIGCAVTVFGARLFAGGTASAYDSVLEISSRDPVIWPFMVKTYNNVFGEGPYKKINGFIEKFVPSETENTENQKSVTEVMKKDHKLSPEEKAECIKEIKEENDSEKK
jgi:hypothetical protein